MNQRPKVPQIFKPEIYGQLIWQIKQAIQHEKVDWESINKLICNLSQHTFEKFMESQDVVYGQLAAQEHVWNTKNPERHDTHFAYLVAPQPLPKQECVNHKANIEYWLISGGKNPMYESKCLDCGTKLKATWTAVE